MNSLKPFIIGIAGGTGSGKTTIARKIVSHFKNHILHIPHGGYNEKGIQTITDTIEKRLQSLKKTL